MNIWNGTSRKWLQVVWLCVLCVYVCVCVLDIYCVHVAGDTYVRCVYSV